MSHSTNIDRDGFLEKYLSNKVFNNDYCMEDFKLHRKVGEGAFSKVYKAKILNNDSNLPDTVAIKITARKTMSKNSLTSKVINEAKLLSCLSHDGIIKYFASFETDNSLNIVLECLLTDLYTILQKQIYFGESAARFLSSQILLGLQYLHSYLVAYRDLKPENILLTGTGRAKLTDFSFAKYIPGRSYTCQGTMEYMAPEVLLNQGHGLSVDMWSFGIFLYELCAGYTPFKTKYQINLVRSIVARKFQFPSYFSDELQDLIKHLLVIDPTKRLGCTRGKEEELKSHAWFGEEIDWDLVPDYAIVLPKELNELKIFDQDEPQPSIIELSF